MVTEKNIAILELLYQYKLKPDQWWDRHSVIELLKTAPNVTKRLKDLLTDEQLSNLELCYKEYLSIDDSRKWWDAVNGLIEIYSQKDCDH